TRADRTRLPVPGPPRAFQFPRIARRRLANGLEMRAVAHRSVPVAAMVLLVPGGSSADAAERTGLASITADLLDEGSRGQSALEVADRIARIGGDFDIEVTSDATVLSLATLDRFFEVGLSLVHEMATAPNLAAADFERVRQLRLERLRQLRNLPTAIADRAFAQVLYQTHPYAQPGFGTAASLDVITLDDVRAFHARMFQPEGVTLVLTGDRDPEDLLALGEAAFGGWQAAHGPAVDLRDRGRQLTPALPGARLAVIDRPGSAQSELRIGSIAARRATPDYHAIVLLNAVLGGQFVSRLNMNLREGKGYTYGVRTGFDLRRGPGPFVVQTSVGTDVTAPAIAEALGELRAIRGERPVTADELALARSSVALGYPRGFEVSQQVARAVSQLALHDLPDSYFEEFVPRLQAVTLDEVAAAAGTYLDPDRMATVVVGDLSRVGVALSTLGLGDPVVVPPQF
ncbi:MAG: insulinase family protein, partial [Acidobacteriota bacterium]|nr:insulinase family protein [Acidobacteriota bacterium]